MISEGNLRVIDELDSQPPGLMVLAGRDPVDVVAYYELCALRAADASQTIREIEDALAHEKLRYAQAAARMGVMESSTYRDAIKARIGS